MRPLLKRGVWILAAVAVAGAVALGVSPFRTAIFRAAGRALVAEDPIEPADVIVIASNADGSGVLEAADLVGKGIATRVAVFADPPDAVDREVLRRGLPYEDAAAR